MVEVAAPKKKRRRARDEEGNFVKVMGKEGKEHFLMEDAPPPEPEEPKDVNPFKRWRDIPDEERASSAGQVRCLG